MRESDFDAATFVAGIIAVIVLTLLAGTACQGQEADIAECVVIPLSQKVKGLCDPVGGGEGGCDLRLSSRDPGRNFWSATHPGGGRPALGFEGSDVVDEDAFRGVYVANFTATGARWTVEKMSVYPATAALLFLPLDPMAVPPDRLAGSDLVDRFRCAETDDGSYVEHNGAYARQFIWGQQASDAELGWLASSDFTREGAYWDAYWAVYEGYVELRGWATNLNAPGSSGAAAEAWRKRWAIFDLMARGSIAEPLDPPHQPWWAAVQACETYILMHVEPDVPRLAEAGLWTEETPALSAAWDHILERTDWRCGVACDPEMIFMDLDVGTEAVTWGLMKALLRLHLPRRELSWPR